MSTETVSIDCPRDGCMWYSGSGKKNRVAELLYDHLVIVHPEGLTGPGRNDAICQRSYIGRPPHCGDPSCHLRHEEAEPDAEPEPEPETLPRDGSYPEPPDYVTLIPTTMRREVMADVMGRCWAIMNERSDKYHEAWYEQGAMMNLAEMRKKMDRIWVVLWKDRDGPAMEDRDYDDCYDLINYTLAFLVQAQLREWDGITRR